MCLVVAEGKCTHWRSHDMDNGVCEVVVSLPYGAAKEEYDRCLALAIIDEGTANVTVPNHIMVGPLVDDSALLYGLREGSKPHRGGRWKEREVLIDLAGRDHRSWGRWVAHGNGLRSARADHSLSCANVILPLPLACSGVSPALTASTADHIGHFSLTLSSMA